MARGSSDFISAYLILRGACLSHRDDLLDSLSTSVLVFDAELRLRRLNAAAEYLLSSSAAKIAGIHFRELFAGCKPCADAIERAMRENQTVTERSQELRLPDNTIRMLDCVATPCAMAAIGGNGVLVELIDVAHYHRLHLEENMNAQSQITDAMLQGLAHEVKNPLGGIRGAAQLLHRELPEPRYGEYISVIISETDRLRALVDRMIAPGGIVEKQAINVHSVLERVRQLVAAEIATELVIERDYDPSLPAVIADPGLLMQVFLNIVRNAVQALHGRRGTITLRTRAQRKFTLGAHVHRLVVRTDVIDDGPGIDPKIKDKLFQERVTTKQNGHGFGLPLCRKIVQNNHGEITVESVPGNGTRFIIVFPLQM